MGYIERSVCRLCGRSWQYKKGCGILHCNLDVVLKLYSDEINEEVKKWMEGKDMPSFQFDYHKAVCKKCKSITSVPVLKLFPENTFYIGKCPSCGDEVKVLKENEDISCPACGGQSWDVVNEGQWD